MKQFNFIKKLMAMPLMAVVALTSCEDKVDATSFKLSSSTLPNINTETTIAHSSPAVGEVVKINVSKEGSLTWKVEATAKAEMFTITPTGSQSESGEISITVKPNTTFSSRTGSVVISDSYTKTDRKINFTQAAAGTPVLTITPSKTVTDIPAAGQKVNFSITVNPVTPLTFEIVDNAYWIHSTTATEGSTNSWTIDANTTKLEREGKIAIKYDGGTKTLDTLYLNQLAPEAGKPTPEITVEANAKNAFVTWTPSADVLTMSITLNDGTPKIVPCADGKLFISGLNPTTSYTVKATGSDAEGTLEPASATFTSKKMTDTYTFKDSKLCENIATWVYALRSPTGQLNNVGRLTNGATTYDTLAMIEDLILSYQFGQSANGLVDLLQCPNITRLQIGRGYYDSGVTITQPKLEAVLTKANFPKLTTIQIFAKGTPPANPEVPAAAQTAFQNLCTAQGYTFINPMVEGLKFPNEGKEPEPEGEISAFSLVPSAGLASVGFVDRSAWKLVYWSTQDTRPPGTGGIAKMLIDNTLSSFWQSNWSAPVVQPPHVFIIDMGKATTVNSVAFATRLNSNAKQGMPLTWTCEFSNDVPTAYPDANVVNGNPSGDMPTGFTFGNSTGEITNDLVGANGIVSNTNAGLFTYTLKAPVTARCVKFTVKTAGSDIITGAQNPGNVCISEFGVK